MPVFLTRMPSGIIGDVSRERNANIQPQIFDTSAGINQPSAYGVALVETSLGVAPPFSNTGATATAIKGVLVRPFPTSSSSIPGTIGGGVPPTTNTAGVPLSADMLVSGYMTVGLYGTTAATRGATVFVRVAASTGTRPLGGFEAAADGANTVALDGTGGSVKAYFTGPSDATPTATVPSQVEIAFNV